MVETAISYRTGESLARSAGWFAPQWETIGALLFEGQMPTRPGRPPPNFYKPPTEKGPRGADPWWMQPESCQKFLSAYRESGDLNFACEAMGHDPGRWYACREIAETGSEYGRPIHPERVEGARKICTEWKRIRQALEDEILDASTVTIRNAISGTVRSRKVVSEYEIDTVETDDGQTREIKRLIKRTVTEDTVAPSWQASFRALEALNAERWARRDPRLTTPFTPDELARILDAATPEERIKVEAGDQSAIKAILDRTGIR